MITRYVFGIRAVQRRMLLEYFMVCQEDMTRKEAVRIAANCVGKLCRGCEKWRAEENWFHPKTAIGYKTKYRRITDEYGKETDD